MKKILYFSMAVLGLSTVACTKNNESVRNQIETTLPSIELTSMGLVNQVGPFTLSDSLIRVAFNGAVTNDGASTFDAAWYDVPSSGSVAPKLIDSTHFNSWNQSVSKTDSNSISVTWLPTTYANTFTYSGNLVLKIKKLPAAQSYTLKLYAHSSGNKVSSISTSKFITKK